jgi:hypothetical protein
MRAHVLVAAGLAAAALSYAAAADELQVSKFRYPDPTIASVFVCPGSVAPNDCNARSALQSIVNPPWTQDAGCGVAGQAVLAGSGLRLEEGQYVKVVCVRDTAQAD